MKKIIKILASLVVSLALIMVSMPGILYVYGLSQVNGHPTPLVVLDAELTEQVWLSCRETMPIQVERLNPWSVFASILQNDPWQPPRPGSRAASLIASSHNINNLKTRGNLHWHNSNMAMTVWITRNWNAQQISQTLAAHGACKRVIKKESMETNNDILASP